MEDILTLGEAEEKARRVTQKELESYHVPDEVRGQTILTTLFEDDDRIFVVYVAGETRDNPKIIARTKVNLKTGDVSVDIPTLKKRSRN